MQQVACFHLPICLFLIPVCQHVWGVTYGTRLYRATSVRGPVISERDPTTSDNLCQHLFMSSGIIEPCSPRGVNVECLTLLSGRQRPLPKAPIPSHVRSKKVASPSIFPRLYTYMTVRSDRSGSCFIAGSCIVCYPKSISHPATGVEAKCLALTNVERLRLCLFQTNREIFCGDAKAKRDLANSKDIFTWSPRIPLCVEMWKWNFCPF